MPLIPSDYGFCDTFLFFAGIIFGLAAGLIIGWLWKKYTLWRFRKTQEELAKRQLG